MANWCSNVVSFTGDKEMIKQAKQLFREMGRKGKKQMLGQMPGFVSKEHPHFFDTYVKKDKVYYLTKWNPNNDALKEIADHFNIGFTNRYDDLPMGLLGETTYKNGRLSNVQLDNHDLQSYEYSEALQAYIYNGNSYVDEWQALMEVLDDKKQFISRFTVSPDENDNDDQFKTTSRIGKDDLLKYYGELGSLDIVVKLAEYENFAGARREFQAWDEESVITVDNYLNSRFRHEADLYKTREKYIAVCFLRELIREWDLNRLEKIQANLPDQQQTQAELLQVRLAGKLPHIDIAGEDFTIDWRLRELRETAAPWNSISINDLTISESGGEYLGLYDVSRKRLYNFDDEITTAPQNVIGIEIPQENRLDPVAVAREKGFDIKPFVTQYPIQENLSAIIRPISETGLPELVEQNLKKAMNPGQTEERARKIGR